jgi:hypothetical protein
MLVENYEAMVPFQALLMIGHTMHADAATCNPGAYQVHSLIASRLTLSIFGNPRFLKQPGGLPC